MKISIGHVITLVFLTFAVFILYMVTRMMGSKVDLVESDYYSKELKFQSQIEKYRNTIQLGDSALRFNQDNQFLQIEINKSNPEQINVYMYYPQNNEKDVLYTFDNTSLCVISKNKISKGRVILKIEWKDENTVYYYEKEMFIY